MSGTSHLFPSRTSAGLLLELCIAWAVVYLHPKNLQEILASDIKGTLYGTTLFAFLVLFIMTLLASLLGRMLFWLGLWLADRRGRDDIYREFELAVPQSVRSKIDSMISNELWAKCTEHSSEKRFFLVMQDHLAVLDFDLFSKTQRDHEAPTGLLRNIATAVLIGGSVLTFAWAVNAVGADQWLVAVVRLVAGALLTVMSCEILMRLYFRSLAREMRRFLRSYLVVLAVKGEDMHGENGVADTS